jgi:hypothetical protein
VKQGNPRYLGEPAGFRGYSASSRIKRIKRTRLKITIMTQGVTGRVREAIRVVKVTKVVARISKVGILRNVLPVSQQQLVNLNLQLKMTFWFLMILSWYQVLSGRLLWILLDPLRYSSKSLTSFIILILQ